MRRIIVVGIALLGLSFPAVLHSLAAPRHLQAVTNVGGGWSRISLPAAEKNTSVARLVAGTSRLLAIGLASNGSGDPSVVMWVSSGGRSWVRVPSPPHSEADPRFIGPIAATRSGFIALDSTSTSTWTSGDGMTWHQISRGTALPQGMSVDAVTSGGPGLVAVGGGLPGRPGYVLQSKTRAAVWTSTDGRRWKQVPYNNAVFGGAEMFSVTATGRGLVASGRTYPAENGEHAVVWTSPDGRTWRRSPDSAFENGTSMNTVIAGAGIVLGLGSTEAPSPYLQSLAWHSYAGVDWTPARGDPFLGGMVNTVAPAGPGFLAAGQQDGDPALWFSPDGSTWLREAGSDAFQGANTQVNGVVAEGNAVVVAGTIRTTSGSGSATAWYWSPKASEGAPAPSPHRTLDPRALRLRLQEVPAGYHLWQGSYLYLCDLEDRPDPGKRCGKLLRTLGRYQAYSVEFVNLQRQSGGPAAIEAAVIVAGSARAAQGATKLGDLIVNPAVGSFTVKALANQTRIGTETRTYATELSIMGRLQPVRAMLWRDGRVIGVAVVAGTLQTQAIQVAERLHRHLRFGPPSLGVQLTPHSPPARIGRPYPFRLYTHCGVGFTVDFDHTFWELTDPAWRGSNNNPPRGIGNPYQNGTMTLLDPNHARFDFQHVHIHFARHVGPKLVPGLCS